MGKKIVILTQSHLCRNPRVVKEANALSAAGFDVSILTTFTFPDLLEEDLHLIDKGVKLKGVVNLMDGHTSSFKKLIYRLERRLAGEAVARIGWQSPRALGYDYYGNLRAALRENADLYLCHQEASTVIGVALLKKGRKVGFDFEDWYSHDLLPEANRTRPLRLLESSEKYALQHATLSYTTSKAMATTMADFAKASEPKVLLNVFPWAEREWMDKTSKDRNDFDRPSLHWYSQTIGPGRGLEFIVESLNQVEVPVQLHLRGNVYGNFAEELRSRLNSSKGHTLHFHALVPHKELLSRIAEHDLGLATEEYAPPSRNLTITNKILQYMLAGIPVLATDTEGQKEVAAQANEVVTLFKGRDGQSFSKALNHLLSDRAHMTQKRAKAQQIAKEKFCWEVEAPKLIRWVETALMHRR